MLERHRVELAELISDLYDGSGSTSELGEKLCRTDQILACYADHPGPTWIPPLDYLETTWRPA